MLTPVLAATSTKTSSGSSSLIFLLLILVVVAFLFLRPGRNNRRKQVETLRQQVVPGAEVRTNAGLYATVVEVDPDYVRLEIAPGVVARFDPRVVVAVISPVEQVPDYPPDESSEPGSVEPGSEPVADVDAAETQPAEPAPEAGESSSAGRGEENPPEEHPQV